MARSVSQAFYRSSKWIKCKNGYMASQHYICERCGGLATICHHKEWLNESNVTNPMIAYNWDNLEAVCHSCHNKEHFGNGIIENGLVFDEKGNLIKI